MASNDVPPPDDVLAARASQIGAEWAEEYVRDLHLQERAAVGGWPGTISEARRRIALRLASQLAP